MLLLAGACAFLRFEPWHGVVVLSLSERHGVDAGDLPAVLLFALAVAIAHGPARSAWPQPRWLVGRRARAASAALLGALLLIGLIDPTSTPRLVPAGGGTFAGSTQHDNGQRSEPVGRWSHLAVTYDGKTLRLYEDGTPVSSQAISGTILKTKDPLWIGGNRPYGEHFQGVIDDVRVYNRALRASEVRAEMSTPVAGDRPRRRRASSGPTDSMRVRVPRLPTPRATAILRPSAERAGRPGDGSIGRCASTAATMWCACLPRRRWI